MTENKRFEINPSAMYNNKYVIHDSKKEYTFPVLDSTLNYMFCKALNELHDENEKLKIFLKAVNEELDLANRDCDILEEENEQLKSDNQELKQDNDIKFWKHECIKEANANSVLLFELGKAIDGGYEVSDKFKDFMNDLNKSIENEKKKLERFGLND